MGKTRDLFKKIRGTNFIKLFSRLNEMIEHLTETWHIFTFDAKKYTKTIEWEKLEISSRKLEIPREHITQR